MRPKILLSFFVLLSMNTASAVTAGLALTPYNGVNLKTAWIAGYVDFKSGIYKIRLPELRYFNFDQHVGVNLISMKADASAVGKRVCKGIGKSFDSVETVGLHITEDHVMTVQGNLTVKMVQTRPEDPNTGLVLFESISCNSAN